MVVNTDCVNNILDDLLKEVSILEEDTEFYTGYVDFDEKHGALKPGELYLIASEPKMGKTAFALNLMNKGIDTGKDSIVYFSLKKETDLLVKRLVTARTKCYPGEKVSKRKYRSAIKDVQDLYRESIVMEDIDCISKEAIIEKTCNSMESINLIVVDHLELIDDLEHSKNALIQLKEIANEYNCPIVVLGNIESICDARANHKPVLEDIQGLEAYVDSVVFLYRDEVYDRETEMNGLAEFYVAKLKNYKPFEFILGFLKEYQYFGNLDSRY